MTSESYASKTQGIANVVRESFYQVKSHVWMARNADGLARHFIETMRTDEALAEAVYGRPLEGLDMLDVGTGSIGSQALYFTCRNNRVTTIDLEQQATAWGPRAFLSLLRESGPRRAIKTAARNAIGTDRILPASLARAMGHATVPTMTALRMDATRMTFPDASFDVVHSYDVLEHVDDVEAVIRGVVRVLRPGGLAYLVLMPYTCENGSHDFRLISGNRGDMPYWAHLRPEHAGRVVPGAFVNKLGLRQVEAICRRHMEGVICRGQPANDPQVRQRLGRWLGEVRAQGELTEYDDEELLAARQQIFWRKPS